MPATSDMAPVDEDLDERFRHLSSWLRSTIARRYGLRPEDADDVVQESFVRLGRYDRIDRGRHPRALLLRIAANLTNDARRRLRARRADQHVGLDAVASLPVGALAQPAEQTFLIDLKTTILGLPEPLRETFLLARFTPLTHSQIASRLGISTKTVEWRISKAVAICLAKLKS